MKIATWNIERLKTRKISNLILKETKSINADILILTEYNHLELDDYGFKVETKNLPATGSCNYSKTERRVVIFSKYPVVSAFETYDNSTSCCAEFKTPNGSLIVYGSIVGILGNRDKNFNSELDMQINDINKFHKKGNFCYAGDLNMSFSDNYYYTKDGRKKFIDCFQKNNLINLTEKVKESIDHIIVNENFLKNSKVDIYEWNTDKKLSDHKGICVEF